MRGHAVYEKLGAETAAAGRERDRLHRAVGLPHKFDDFIALTPQDQERVRAYREAVRKLTWHRLPDLYTPEHSIFLYHSQDGWSYVYDKEAAAECLAVQEMLLRYFGSRVADDLAHHGGQTPLGLGQGQPLCRPRQSSSPGRGDAQEPPEEQPHHGPAEMEGANPVDQGQDYGTLAAQQDADAEGLGQGDCGRNPGIERVPAEQVGGDAREHHPGGQDDQERAQERAEGDEGKPRRTSPEGTDLSHRLLW
jgi:hypothetical protein